MEAITSILFMVILGALLILGWCAYKYISLSNQNTEPEVKTEKTTRFVDFDEAFINYFKKYFSITGTATRAEYWWIMLPQGIINVIMQTLVKADIEIPMVISMIFGLFSLFVLVPNITLTARRLHDIGKSGWDVPLSLLIGIGSGIIGFAFVQKSILVSGIFMLIGFWFIFVLPTIWLASPSKYKNNKYRIKKR